MAAGYRTVPAPGPARAPSNVPAARDRGTVGWRVAASPTETSRAVRTGTSRPLVAAMIRSAAAAAGTTARTTAAVAMRVAAAVEAVEMEEPLVEAVAVITGVQSGVSLEVGRRRRWRIEGRWHGRNRRPLQHLQL